ncbi:hypothetical protein [Micavibrio aeruginosavorus]|uniref:hypothetical protein n=1 Tax=Micavibrio aeruginosavorus TaxID=349221 RepID=UPI003F4ADCC2
MQKILNFVAGIAIIAGGIELFVSTIMPNHLEGYKEGSMKTSLDLGPVYREGAADQCLVEKPETRRHFTFKQADTRSIILFAAKSFQRTETELGSIPDFKVINTPCDQIASPVRKWDTLQDFVTASKGDFEQISTKLKTAANQPGTTNLSVLVNQIKPVTPQ